MFLRYQHSNYSGDLRSRLETFNLYKYFGNYPLLVKYDWLRPAFHVPVPAECFRNDSDLPVQWPPLGSRNLHWADAYDFQMSISEPQIGTDEWFVHPLVRRGPGRLDFFDHAISNQEDFSWKKLHLADGRKFVPAFDYFYEWQIFRFADVVQRMHGFHQHFWQLGEHAELIRYANEVSANDFDKVADIPIWTTRAETFTWLAHFIAYRDAFAVYVHKFVAKHKNADVASYPALNEKLRGEEKLGATQLMTWLGITPEVLEHALQHQILTLARDWQGTACQYDKTAQKLPLWYALQGQVRAAVDWLCLANEDSHTTYLDRLRYGHFGQREWAQLQDVYVDPRWKAACLVSSEIIDVAKKYSTGARDFARDFSPGPAQLIALTENAVTQEPTAFGSYLDALGNFLDESQHSTGDNPNRPRNRTSWCRVMAVMAENVLKDVVHDRMIDKEKFAYQAVARILANRGEQWWDFVNTQGGVKSDATLMNISERVVDSSSCEDLILNFSLAVHYARNVTVHQSKWDSHFLYAEWVGEIFEALVLFVPWALMQLQPAEQPESIILR